MGCVFAYTILLTLIGPEKLGKKFDAASDYDLADAAGTEAISAAAKVGGRRNNGTARHDEEVQGASSGSDLEGEREKKAIA